MSSMEKYNVSAEAMAAADALNSRFIIKAMVGLKYK